MGLGWAWTTNAENHIKELNNLHVLLLSHLHIIVSIVPGCMNANVSPGVRILAYFKKSFALVNQLPYPSTAVCKNKSAECVQPDEYPVGIFQQWLQHTLATERGPRAPLVFYIEARSLFQNRRHHREGATTENTQDCFAWGRFGRQVISFAWGDKERYVGGSESHGFVIAFADSLRRM